MGGQTVPVGSTEVNRPAPVCFGEIVLPGSTFVKLVFVWQPTTTHLIACDDRAGAHPPNSVQERRSRCLLRLSTRVPVRSDRFEPPQPPTPPRVVWVLCTRALDSADLGVVRASRSDHAHHVCVEGGDAYVRGSGCTRDVRAMYAAI